VFYPKSSRTYQTLAQAYQKKNDRDAAIKALEKAVELDANNAQAKAQLQQLRGQ
jgi:predicted Zn-dependent protease